MHYKNGREAKNGDKVVLFQDYTSGGKKCGSPTTGILYDAQVGNNTCNGKLAPIRPNDACPNLAECLHYDDVQAALGDISKVPDTSAK